MSSDVLAVVVAAVSGVMLGIAGHRVIVDYLDQKRADVGDLAPPGRGVVVIAVTIACVAAGARFGWEPELIAAVAVFAALVTVSIVDLRAYLIPDRLLRPATFVVLAVIVAMGIADDQPIGPAVVGVLVFAGLLLAMAVVGSGLGLGDVKLAVPAGLLMGWLAADAVDAFRAGILALLVGSLLGLLGGFTLMGLRRVTGRNLLADPEADADAPITGMKVPFPFGPALSLASILISLWIGPFSG